MNEQPRTIPNPLWCDRCEGRGYVVYDAEWEQYAVQCHACTRIVARRKPKDTNAMTEYVPGPWTIEEYGDEDCPALVIHKDTDSRICFMATPGSHGDQAKIEADARLICAAPALYKAARAIDALSLVIESAVRNADTIKQHSAVVRALQANRAAIEAAVTEGQRG